MVVCSIPWYLRKFWIYLDIDWCIKPTHTCSYGGTCVDGLLTSTCICREGYKGPLCEGTFANTSSLFSLRKALYIIVRGGNCKILLLKLFLPIRTVFSCWTLPLIHYLHPTKSCYHLLPNFFPTQNAPQMLFVGIMVPVKMVPVYVNDHTMEHFVIMVSYQSQLTATYLQHLIKNKPFCDIMYDIMESITDIVDFKAKGSAKLVHYSRSSK